eukprot:scaffold251248_cov18-Tisochrysis_lutea.AAC.1
MPGASHLVLAGLIERTAEMIPLIIGLILVKKLQTQVSQSCTPSRQCTPVSRGVFGCPVRTGPSNYDFIRQPSTFDVHSTDMLWHIV